MSEENTTTEEVVVPKKTSLISEGMGSTLALLGILFGFIALMLQNFLMGGLGLALGIVTFIFSPVKKTAALCLVLSAGALYLAYTML
ncbi:hypothetical protein EDC19_1554 [Natranaerovirga hydrolytica]|uniref:Uncharacterized protein n=1 Tax=Natranaerovirga hydrolytica TaxID=680378 RepID=A0A4V2Q0D4_9FIRM|nr:hypothetical protein [Natranaerovirga hydrolytica]TCK93361.1 hypothetical protein EDC19_1554 [Natranaerovirga hydrolytica]